MHVCQYTTHLKHLICHLLLSLGIQSPIAAPMAPFLIRIIDQAEKPLPGVLVMFERDPQSDHQSLHSKFTSSTDSKGFVTAWRRPHQQQFRVLDDDIPVHGVLTCFGLYLSDNKPWRNIVLALNLSADQSYCVVLQIFDAVSYGVQICTFLLSRPSSRVGLRRWTPEEDAKLLGLRDEGRSYHDIKAGDMLPGRTTCAMAHRCKLLRRVRQSHLRAYARRLSGST